MTAKKDRGHAQGASPLPRVSPVHVDQRSRRSGDDALEGHFVTVTAGEHEGKVGVFQEATKVDKDGYPVRAIVKFRDPAGDTAVADVPYKDLSPTSFTGGR